MKAVEISKVGCSKVIEMDVPRIEPDEVLIRVHATGICASDIAAYLGQHPYRVPPVISGHESAGEIIEIGRNVKGFKLGEKVVVEPQIGCGACWLCKNGDYNICKQKRLMGTPNWVGGFAQYIAVPAPCIYKIPSDMPYPEATLIEPLSVGLHAIARSGLKGGESVAVLGTGAIGLMLVLSNIYGKAGSVICSDIKEEKLEFAKSLGAKHVFNPRKTNVTEEILKLTDSIGVDIAFVTVGTDAIMDDALDITRPKGKIIAVANFKAYAQVGMPKVQLQEREIIGTAMYTRDDYLAAVEMMPHAITQLTGFITHRIGIEDLPAMLDAMAGKKIDNAVKIVVNM